MALSHMHVRLYLFYLSCVSLYVKSPQPLFHVCMSACMYPPHSLMDENQLLAVDGRRVGTLEAAVEKWKARAEELQTIKERNVELEKKVEVSIVFIGPVYVLPCSVWL